MLSGWLNYHGWRSLNYDPGSPPIAERPSIISRMLLDGFSASSAGLETRDSTEAEALSKLSASDTNEFKILLNAARRAYPNREENVIYTDNIRCGLLRRWVIEVGRRLNQRGLLPVVDGTAGRVRLS